MSGYDAALAAIERLEAFGIRLGLENVRAWCEASDHPERAAPVAHVAGTNGKGTTAACLDAIARGHGLSVGRYTSPHIIDFRERILVDGRPIEGGRVAALWDRIRGFVEERQMTYFESATLIAFERFREAGVDLAIHEVGMGGRLDATNVVDPEVALVTNVARDHEAHLGESPAEIAREKAGIFAPGRPALVGDPGPPEVRAIFEDVATEVGAVLEFVSDEVKWSVTSMNPSATGFDYVSPERSLQALAVPAAGEHFAADAALAVRAFERLGAAGAAPPIEEDALREALAGVALPGRMEVYRTDGVEVVLDAAHNPAAIGRLAATLRGIDLHPCAVVVGILSDKRWETMLDALEPVAAMAWLCELASASAGRRLTEPKAARPVAARPWVAWADSVAVGLREARAMVEAGEATRIVVTGSFYTVGEALLALGLAAAGRPYPGSGPTRSGAPGEPVGAGSR